MNNPLYLDYNSTTPVDARVVQAMLPFFTEQFGNAASSNHRYGWQAQEAVTIAREQIGNLIGAVKEEIVFTSGATESINLAIRGVVEAYASKGNHIITCATEHRAVIDTCKSLEKKGIEVTVLPVNKQGFIDLDELTKSIKPTTILICILYANNETGVLQPIEKIGKIAKEKKVLFFCDATQAVGKIPIDVLKDNIDLMAFSSHKLYGPKGCGALYIRRKNPRVSLKEQITGGGHERNFRSGTLNVPGIVGFGKAAELCIMEMEVEASRLLLLRDKFEKVLLTKNLVTINGDVTNRLAHVSNLCFNIPNGASLLASLSKLMAVSSGSACSSSSTEPSHVLKAMGLTDEASKSSIRFSLGRFTTKAEMDWAGEQIINILTTLRIDKRINELL
jgi:cysteine desulfurase